uniref:50S ribosomal protein L31 n=1 Tax=candidate division CPR3 bacterium TaxID=2268181 RepID=A0A7C5YV26_UNCC3
MKKKIHPKYHTDVEVICSCGNRFTIGGSTVETIRTEYCYKCHPAYTGEQKVADVTTKIKRFEERVKKSEIRKREIQKIEETRKKKVKKPPQKELTLKDIIKQMKAQGAKRA